MKVYAIVNKNTGKFIQYEGSGIPRLYKSKTYARYRIAREIQMNTYWSQVDPKQMFEAEIVEMELRRKSVPKESLELSSNGKDSPLLTEESGFDS